MRTEPFCSSFSPTAHALSQIVRISCRQAFWIYFFRLFFLPPFVNTTLHQRCTKLLSLASDWSFFLLPSVDHFVRERRTEKIITMIILITTFNSLSFFLLSIFFFLFGWCFSYLSSSVSHPKRILCGRSVHIDSVHIYSPFSKPHIFFPCLLVYVWLSYFEAVVMCVKVRDWDACDSRQIARGKTAGSPNDSRVDNSQ